MAKEPWFEYLLRNKAIRTFLSNYADSDWQEVSKLAVLYGILGFNYAGRHGILPLEKLRELVASGATAATVQSALPDLNEKVDDLRSQLDDVALEIKGQGNKGHVDRQYGKRVSQDDTSNSLAQERRENHLRADAAAANVALRHAERWLKYHDDGLTIDPQQMPRRIVKKAVAAAAAERAVGPIERAPAEWRLGDPHRTYSPPGKKRSPSRPGDGLMGAQYPSWWGDGGQWADEGPASRDEWGGRHGAGRGGRSRSAPRPDRRPPRLAYSVQQEAGKPLWHNDLVTSRYLDVPSSGYGRYSPPRVGPQYAPLGPLAAPAPGPSYGPPAANNPYPIVSPTASRQLFAPPPPLPPPVMAGPYGSGHAEGRAPGPWPQLYVAHPSGAMVPVAMQPPQTAPAYGQPQHQQQRQVQGQEGPAANKPGWKPIRTAKGGSSGTQSRIRELVRADREAARQRAEARQRAVAAAVAGAASGQAVASVGVGAGVGHGQPLQDRPRPPSAGPSDIADALAANPYTAWFIDPQQAQHQQQHQAATSPQRTPRQVQAQQQKQQRRHPFELDPIWGPRGPTHDTAQQQQQQQQPQWSQQEQWSGGGFPTGSPPRSPPSAPPFAPPSSLYPPGSPFGNRPARGQQLGGSPSSYSPSSDPYSSPYQPYSNWFGEGAAPRAGGGRGRDGFAGDNPTRRAAWARGAPGGPVHPGWLGAEAWGDGPSGAWPPQPPQQQQQPYGSWDGSATLGRGWNAGLGGGAGSGAGGGGGWWGPGAAAAAPAGQGLSPRDEALRVVRPEVVKWSKSWVGDFGHLGEPPRDAAAAPPPPASSTTSQPASRDSASGAVSGASGAPGGGRYPGVGLDPIGHASSGGQGPIAPPSRSASVGGGLPPRPGSAAGAAAVPPGHANGLTPAAAALAAADALLAAAAASLEERSAAAAAITAGNQGQQQPGLRPSNLAHAPSLGGGDQASQMDSVRASRVASGGGSGGSNGVGGGGEGGAAGAFSRQWAGSGGGAAASRNGSGGGDFIGGVGSGAGAVSAEGMWGSVMGQVTRLAQATKMELGAGSEDGGAGGGAGFDIEEGRARGFELTGGDGGGGVSEGLGGVGWDFERILAPPTSLTYQ